MIRIFLILLSVICINVCVWGQNSPEKQVENFHKEFVTNPNNAIKNLMLPITEDELKIEEIQNAYKKAVANYGRCGGLDFISKKELGQSIVKLNYFFRHKKYPLIFEFIYYRFDNEWVVVNFKFNDELRVILDNTSEK